VLESLDSYDAPAGSGFTAAGPSTTNNDDSCDISTAPAATLLLPYFEVDVAGTAATAQTTLFTITNVTDIPQIAHVTIWTDWSFPVLDFNIFLTGYDVQGINLYDVLARGVIAPGNTPAGTSNQTTPGDLSLDNDANPNFNLSGLGSCALLPGPIPGNILAEVRSGLTTGVYASTCPSNKVGGTHANAIGYVTIDVANTCSTTLPNTSSYYSTEILYDNVLIGDYQQLNPNPTTGNYAGGNPLVHIRAVPEGGAAGSIVAPGTTFTNLPYTFYDRYTPTLTRQIDRRQPLPSTFAARFIQGGTGAFNTDYKIWREGVNTTACSSYALNTGTGMQVTEIVRFDEHENPTINSTAVVISPRQSTTVILPETSRTSTSNGIFPPLSTESSDVAGWMYLNLNNGGNSIYSVTPARAAGFAVNGTTVRQNQNWAIVSMFAEGRFSVDFDAAWLGNGCSPAPAVSNASNPAGLPIGPAPNATP
jgi:hypothetical protein